MTLAFDFVRRRFAAFTVSLFLGMEKWDGFTCFGALLK
jgi:hypothetical protein